MHEKDRLEVFEFVRDLIRATERGGLTWEGNQDGSVFSLRTPIGIVYIASLGGSGGHPYALSIFDTDDREIFVTRTQIGEWYNEEEETLARLFTSAHSSIFDISGTIKKMRRSLDLD